VLNNLLSTSLLRCTQTSRNSIWISTMVTIKQNIQIIRWTHKLQKNPAA